MKLGIVQTIELAATLVFAAPLGLFGISRLLEGDLLLGTGLATIAVLMVLVPQYLTTPGDVPGALLGAVGLGGEAEENTESGPATPAEGITVNDEQDSP
jgi:hypothetical protein